jgi:hypothetical protein
MHMVKHTESLYYVVILSFLCKECIRMFYCLFTCSFLAGVGYNWKCWLCLWGTIPVRLGYFWFHAPVCIALKGCEGEAIAEIVHCILYYIYFIWVDHPCWKKIICLKFKLIWNIKLSESMEMVWAWACYKLY